MSQPETETSRFFESNVRRFGYGYRALGFGRRSSQEKRFGALAAVGDFDGASVLDVGCGFGDLLAWLRARGVQPRYTGLEFSDYLCKRYGWTQGSLSDWRAAPFELVVCYDVL